jgi:outer membrane protein OmpA-like peptidoglycan-associated protein
MKNKLLFLCLIVIAKLSAQDYLGLQSSNYAGVAGIYSNPANIVDNRMKFDLVLGGLNFIAENNYVSVRRSALKYTGKLTDPENLKFPDSWENTNKNSPDYWKNNFRIVNSDRNKSVYSKARITMPSFMVNINNKNSIAFTWSIRNYLNIDGISPDLARLAFEEFNYPTLFVQKLENKRLSIQQMTWAEYGLTYGRVLKQEGAHFLKAAATVKLLQGLGAAYFFVDNLKYEFIADTTLSLFQSNIQYGHSDNVDFTNQNNIKYEFKSYPGVGFDIGAVYEWRPDFEKYKYDMDGEKGLWRNDKNKYKLKASFAINDIGSIRYNLGTLANNFQADIGYWNIKDVQVNSVGGFDTLMLNMFPSKRDGDDFRMMLPTTINANVDYHIWKPFYANLMVNAGNFYKNRPTKVSEYTLISLTPRFDHKWFGVSVPISWGSIASVRREDLMLGSMVRLGPLVFGVNNMLGLLTKDMYGVDFYTMVKVPIPYGKPKDRDKDGISNKKDQCVDVPGVWEFMGCPDKDGDHIQDKDDKCPDVAGFKELQGCPDKDGDGITDAEDACVDVPGLKEFKGCPDKDGDKIIDKDDECPDDAGLAEFMGCPDKDGDGTPDKLDACPDVFGPKEFKGCPDKDGDTVLDKDDGCPDVKGPVENKGCPYPDTDKDGVFDKDDACPTTPGLVELKGCPPPPPMKEAELRILEKAFESLEFATGKDIIKPVSFPSLKDLAKLMKEHKLDWKLKLSGHTDNQGDAAKNMLLSEKRSKAVKAYLVKNGVPAENITAEWFGSTQPIADNNTAAGRQKNRRVEMKVNFRESTEKLEKKF